MTREELKQKLNTTRNLSDFSKYYKQFPELGGVISAAIIQAIKETTEGGNRFSQYELQSLIPLHRQIGIDRSSKKVEQKSYLPYQTQKAYSELRSLLKTKGGLVPLTEIRKQPLFQEPNIKQWLLAEYPKGLTFEDVGNFWLYYTGDEHSYTVMQGDYGEDIQTLESVKHFPRKTFILTIDDLLEAIGKENDPSYQTFVNDMLINGVHEESVGIPGKTFGWIIYREIDENTMFIEQAQTDLYRIFHRIRKGIEHFGLPDAMYQQIVQALGGQKKVEEIEATFSKYVENYFEVLLSAFMEEYREKDLYISTPEMITKSVPDDPPTHIYKKVPEKFKFVKVPAEQAPFDTEGLPVYYRHNAYQRLKNHSKIKKIQKYSVLYKAQVSRETLQDMKYFGLSKTDIDEEGCVTLYHGGKQLPSRLKKDEIFFMTPDRELAEDYARLRKGQVFTLKVNPEDVRWNQGSAEVEYTKGGFIRDGYIIPPTEYQPRENVKETYKGVKVGDVLPITGWQVQDIVVHSLNSAQFLLKNKWYDADMVIAYEFNKEK